MIRDGLNSSKDLDFLLRRLIFFYDDKVDAGKLVSGEFLVILKFQGRIITFSA